MIIGKYVKSGDQGPALVLDCAYRQRGGYEGDEYHAEWAAGFVLLVQLDGGHVVEWMVGTDSDVDVVDPPADAPVTATGALVVPFAMAERLVKAIRRRDYCYLCDHVPSHGHADNCPLADAPRMTHSFLGGGTPTCCLCGRPASDHPGFR